MAKQRPPTRPAARKSLRPARREPAGRSKPTPRRRPVKHTPQPAPEPVVQRRATYVEAVKAYETGLESLQRRQFDAAAEAFRRVIEAYPEERELHERARLYLRVCERETVPPPPPPRTLDERIYAATLALNAGSAEEALQHLEPAAEEEPDNDHVLYMLAVAHALVGHGATAVDHLRRAVELNSENRLLARQEPDFASLRDDEAFRQITDASMSSAGGRRRTRARPKG